MFISLKDKIFIFSYHQQLQLEDNFEGNDWAYSSGCP